MIKLFFLTLYQHLLMLNWLFYIRSIKLKIEQEIQKMKDEIRITKLQTKLENTVKKRKKVESLSQALSNRLSSNSVSDPCEEFSSCTENSKINSLPSKEPNIPPRSSRRLAQASVPRFKGKIVFKNVRKPRSRPAKKNILEDDIPSPMKSMSSIPIIKVVLHPTLFFSQLQTF